jgi:acetylornithine/succinyldiaminopimelate/putrescine aminotransferase
VFVASGSEATDLAIKSARHATGRRKVVALEAGFHGTSGLSGAAGNDDSAHYFRSDYPDEFVKVPFNQLDAMEKALSGGDVAAVLLETIPATYGFPLPEDGYLPEVKSLCERYGALYVADEVQTGLGRTGHVWGVDAYGVEPDLLITGKGLSGGLYPIAAVVMTREVGAWLHEKGWGHVTTFGGSERHPFLVGVRRKGLVMGLELDHPLGAVQLSAALYRNGVWAMFSGFDMSVLQFKPGLLVDETYCGAVLDRLDAALAEVERGAF